MENKIKISIIMPVYNSGNYLKTAVDSILSQSLKEIELILVDDGSTDGSSDHCDEYARKDSRVVVIHQKNGGICNARNAALKIARGEYIGFADHDDEFVAGCHKTAYSFAVKHDLDMVKFGHKAIKTNGKTILKTLNFQFDERIYTSEESTFHYLELLQHGQMECVWDSLYKKAFLDAHNLQLDPEFKAGGEDVDFNGRVITCAPKLGVMHEVFYMHYIRVGFSTSTKFKDVNVKLALSVPSKIRKYLSSINADNLFLSNSQLYADIIIQRSVGSLLSSVSMPACNYSDEKIDSLLEKIRKDANIHPCFFKISQIGFIFRDIKYGLLYWAFIHRKYKLCRLLYKTRNLRYKSSFNKMVASNISQQSLRNKKKVTVITLQNVRNYGSALQALATQQFFENLGCNVDFINYVRTNISSHAIKAKGWCEGMWIGKRIVYTTLLYPTFYRQDIVFDRFLKKHLRVQNNVVTSHDDFAKLTIDSDIYCTGSDQTWNSDWNGGILPELFLDFVPNNVKKISYAASMGKGALDEWEKQQTKKLLERYSAISVREKSAVDIIKGLGIDDVEQLLDPTLQMNRDFWMGFTTKPKEKGYLLIYQLNTNPKFDNYAVEFAKRRGLKLLRFCTRYDQVIKPGKPLIIPEVTDFISYIAYADCVITDSFHATAFSINLNTNFISIYPHEFGGRLASILELTGLQSRHLTSYDDFSLADNMAVNFSHANYVLEEERQKAVKFMNKAIGK